MKKRFLAAHAAVLLLVAGCAFDENHKLYPRHSLNNVSLGHTKAQLLAYYPTRLNANIAGMEIRASQKNTSGKLIEVGEVSLTDGVTPTVSYWFIFENGLLVQWGRPEDWQQAAIRYEINYNRQPGVPQR